MHQPKAPTYKWWYKKQCPCDVIEGHTKASLGMRKVEDHVCPGLTRRVLTISVLLSSLFQARVSNFAIYILMMQDATITEQNMRINILKSSGLAKPEDLIMYKAVLNNVQFFDIIYDSPTCFSYSVLYKKHQYQ
jgi:hypothetical protein